MIDIDDSFICGTFVGSLVSVALFLFALWMAS